MTVNKGIGREELLVSGKIIPNDCIGRGAKIVSLTVGELVIGSLAVYRILDTADIDLAENTAVAGSKGNGYHCNGGIIGKNHNVDVAYVSTTVHPIGKAVSVKRLDEEGHRINATHLKHRVFIH